jgi:hypothetical protein
MDRGRVAVGWIRKGQKGPRAERESSRSGRPVRGRKGRWQAPRTDPCGGTEQTPRRTAEHRCRARHGRGRGSPADPEMSLSRWRTGSRWAARRHVRTTKSTVWVQNRLISRSAGSPEDPRRTPKSTVLGAEQGPRWSAKRHFRTPESTVLGAEQGPRWAAKRRFLTTKSIVLGAEQSPRRAAEGRFLTPKSTVLGAEQAHSDAPAGMGGWGGWLAGGLPGLE